MIYRNNTVPLPANLMICKVGILLCELSKDENDNKILDIGDPPSSLHALWHSDFYSYLNLRDQLLQTYYFNEVDGMQRGLGVEGDCNRGRGGTGVGRR